MAAIKIQHILSDQFCFLHPSGMLILKTFPNQLQAANLCLSVLFLWDVTYDTNKYLTLSYFFYLKHQSHVHRITSGIEMEQNPTVFPPPILSAFLLPVKKNSAKSKLNKKSEKMQKQSRTVQD